MSLGARLYNDNGRVAFDAGYKNYVFDSKVTPFVTSMNAERFTSLACNLSTILPASVGTDILPFFRSIDGTPIGMVAVIANYNGSSNFIARGAQTGSTITFESYIPLSVHTGPAKVNTADVTITSVGTPYIGTYDFFGLTVTRWFLKVTFSTSISVANYAPLYTRIGGTLIKACTNGGPISASNYEFYIFKKITGTLGSGFGMRCFDESGAVTFDSNQKLLKVVASAPTPVIAGGQRKTMPSFAVEYGSIPTNHAIFCPNMGIWDRMGDSPSPYYSNPSVQLQTLHAVKKSASEFQVAGCGNHDFLYGNTLQESPSFVGVASPGNGEALAINTDFYA